MVYLAGRGSKGMITPASAMARVPQRLIDVCRGGSPLSLPVRTARVSAPR